MLQQHFTCDVGFVAPNLDVLLPKLVVPVLNQAIFNWSPCIHLRNMSEYVVYIRHSNSVLSLIKKRTNERQYCYDAECTLGL